MDVPFIVTPLACGLVGAGFYAIIRILRTKE